MAAIYDQHDKAFAKVSAFVILDASGDRIATVAIKFPADGAGRLWAYVHLIGCEMTRSHADGYGYDKRTPAVAGAVGKIKLQPREGTEPSARDVELAGHIGAMQSALINAGGEYWDRTLEKAGYRVLQAV